MPLVYCGRAFRKRHSVTQIELAQGAGVRPGTLVDLEKGRALPSGETVAQIIAFFHRRGIPCTAADLLVYEDEEWDGRRDASE